jgi:hypothetical protein
MLTVVVALVCFHIICVGSLNETSSGCDDTKNCVTLCCNRESDDRSCETLSDSELLDLFRNLSVPQGEVKYANPCDSMSRAEDDEWIFEVCRSVLRSLLD